MKIAQLFHNPKAGSEEHSKKKLINKITEKGFECRYNSTKEKDWNILNEDIDFLIAAGGDGTVRKITKQLLERKLLEKTFPIALLPLGTANNIAKTLKLPTETDDIIQSWEKAKVIKYDVGRIYNIKKHEFFLESFGFGIFPYLIQKMVETGREDIEDPEEKMMASLHLLHEIIYSYEPRYCKLEIDDANYSGKYFLLEVMNTKSFGPNLFLSPKADPSDGKLDVVMIHEQQRDSFAEYVLDKINGKEPKKDFGIIKAENITMSWDGSHVHVDDEIVKLKKLEEVKIQVLQGLLEFMIPTAK